jgi:uncharacterized membrane protein YbhN (UPF0104 family)
MSGAMQAFRSIPRSESAPGELTRGRLQRFQRGSVAARLLTIAVLVAALVSLLVAVPGLNTVAGEIGHLSGGWLILAVALELASCASFVVVFRHFFKAVPARAAKELAWTEMGSGALLPGGGLGSLAVGGWLLHLAGMPTRKIVRNSSGLFFLTSAVNVAALILGGSLLASGLSAGQHDLLRAALPILVGSSAVGLALAVARLIERRPLGFAESSWAAQLVEGIGEAERALRHPSWRLIGAIGYLGFDIAVLAAALTAVGYSPPLAVLILGYIIGYLANAIPVPGAVGVLEGGLAGTLVLYGAPVTQATAGVLIYHAIAFWVPSIGGLLGYRLLRLRLAGGATFAIVAHEAPAQPPSAIPPVPTAAGKVGVRPPCQRTDNKPYSRSRRTPRPSDHSHAPSPPALPGGPMDKPTIPIQLPRSVTRPERPSPHPQARRTGRRSRHIEAHAAAWLRNLRTDKPARP